MVRPMTSITVKLSEALDRKLRSVAKSRGENVSELARRALEKEVAEGVPDFAKMAERYKGMFNGPTDLSSREGYGSLDAR
jgi:predicted transcriptional regulator